MHSSGIYEIQNTVNGKRYIGSTILFAARFQQHWNDLENRNHSNRHLQFAWNKYGRIAFQFHILLYCDPENLLFYEQCFLDRFNSLYNLAQVAGSNLGYKHSEETKKNMSRAHIGLIPSEETREKMSVARIGIPRSDAVKLKIAKSHKGIRQSEESKRKLSKAHIGKKLSIEHKRKIAQSMIGKNVGIKRTEEQRKMNSEGHKGKVPWNKGLVGAQDAWNKGIPMSEETKLKISMTKKRRK